MIREDKYEQSLRALQFVLVRARFLAYQGESQRAGDLLDGAELLPEYLAVEEDMTDEFRETLAGLAQTEPGCAQALHIFDGTPAANFPRP